MSAPLLLLRRYYWLFSGSDCPCCEVSHAHRHSTPRTACSFHSLPSFAASVGLCAFWGWKDRKAKAYAKTEAAAMAASVDAEKARAAAVEGFNFGASGAAAPAAHGGYTAMH